MLPLSLALKTGKAQAITVLKEAPSLFVVELSPHTTASPGAEDRQSPDNYSTEGGPLCVLC